MTGSRDVEGMVVFPVGRVMNAWLKEDLLDAYETELQGLLCEWGVCIVTARKKAEDK